MKIDWEKLEQVDKRIVYGVAGGVILLILLIIGAIVWGGKKNRTVPEQKTVTVPAAQKPDEDKNVRKKVELLTGVQGLLAGVAVMEDDTILVTDEYSKVIWQIKDGKATVLAGKTGPEDEFGEPLGGYHDAKLEDARFEKPWGIAKYLNGWAVCDSTNRVIRYFDGELVRTAAYKNSERTLVNPMGLASDDEGNLYIADAGADMVYKMDTKGILTPLADGFNAPCGVCWSNGTLYVADTGNHRICVIENGLIRVFAGSREGFKDGAAEESCFQNPQGVTVGEDGCVYVADTGNSAIRVIKDGEVKTLLNCTNDGTWPVAPVSLAPYKGGLVVVDDFAGVVFTMPYVKK